MENNNSNLSLPRSLVGLGILLLLALGLRLTFLGFGDTKGDEIGALQELLARMGPLESWNAAWRDFPHTSQMPLPHFGVTLVAYLFNLEPSLFATRISFVLLGLLVVPGLWLLGCNMGSRRLGWVMAFLGAINPYAIFWSRTAHVYGYVLPFIVFAYAFLWPLLMAVMRGERWRTSDVLGATAFSVLAAYSHLSTWLALGPAWAFIIGGVLFGKLPLSSRERVVFLICCLLFVVSLVPWFLNWLVMALKSPEESGRLTSRYPWQAFVALYKIPFVYNWGGNFWRAIITLGLLIGGLVAGFWQRRSRGTTLVVCVWGLVFAGLATGVIAAQGHFYNMRYYSALWPFMIFLAATALLGLANFLQRLWPRLTKVWLPLVCLVPTMAAAGPNWWILNLNGNPIPFSQVCHWLDNNFPKRQLVLIDSWVIPQLMMRWHHPTNAIITYTVPETPLKNFIQLHWRDTAIDFLTRFKDAVYFDQQKVYYYEPEGGFWYWPRQYFHRRGVITNREALYLNQAVIAPAEDYYDRDLNGIIFELFYNTTEDVLDNARRAGKKAEVLFTDGWGYVKTQDFRDWRVPDPQASLSVYNLTAGNIQQTVRLKAVAVEGDVDVDIPGKASHTFRNGVIDDWAIGPLDFVSGKNVLTLKVRPRGRGVLLVYSVEIDQH